MQQGKIVTFLEKGPYTGSAIKSLASLVRSRATSGYGTFDKGGSHPIIRLIQPSTASATTSEIAASVFIAGHLCGIYLIYTTYIIYIMLNIYTLYIIYIMLTSFPL